MNPAFRAARELPDQKRVHIAEEHFAGFRTLPQPGDILKQPQNLQAAEIRGKRQAGTLAKAVLAPLFRELADQVSDARVLPDDRRMHGPAGTAFPEDGCLPLIGDADGGKVCRLQATPLHRARNHFLRALPDFLGVVLHPAGLGADLPVFLLLTGEHASGRVKHDEAGAGCPLVDGTEIFSHWRLPLRARWLSVAVLWPRIPGLRVSAARWASRVRHREVRQSGPPPAWPAPNRCTAIRGAVREHLPRSQPFRNGRSGSPRPGSGKHRALAAFAIRDVRQSGKGWPSLRCPACS